jgi:hypothetical protein
LATDRLHFGHPTVIVAFAALRRLTGRCGLGHALRPDALAPVFGDARHTIGRHAAPYRIAKSLGR